MLREGSVNLKESKGEAIKEDSLLGAPGASMWIIAVLV